MGFIRDAKASALGTEAQKAAERGDNFFTPLMNLPATHATVTSNIRDWADMLESVTAEGWTLHTWAVARDSKDRLQAMPLFVRN